LAHDNPQHREELLPLLKQAAAKSEEDNDLHVWADMEVLDAIWRGLAHNFKPFEKAQEKQLKEMSKQRNLK
jgi:hypothetical protein